MIEWFFLAFTSIISCNHSSVDFIPMIRLVTVKEYLRGRHVQHPLTQEMEGNMGILLKRINALGYDNNKPMVAFSGYRPPYINRRVNGSKKSNHLTCAAIDLLDLDGSIGRWLTKNKHLLKRYKLYMENVRYTKFWVHLQIYPPNSGSRIFNP